MSGAEGPLGVVNMAATTLYVSEIDKAIDWYATSWVSSQPRLAATSFPTPAISSAASSSSSSRSTPPPSRSDPARRARPSQQALRPR
jgi:hypothetical protein